jgi:hypothetical protein
LVQSIGRIDDFALGTSICSIAAVASGGAVADVVVAVGELLSRQGDLVGQELGGVADFAPLVVVVFPGGAVLAGVGAAPGAVVGVADGGEDSPSKPGNGALRVEAEGGMAPSS